MDVPTMNVAKYIQNTGINLTALARKTGISYFKLYNSLSNKNLDRDLKAGEYLTICQHLGLDPMRFAEEPKM